VSTISFRADGEVEHALAELMTDGRGRSQVSLR
jgi:hypothetical protein